MSAKPLAALLLFAGLLTASDRLTSRPRPAAKEARNSPSASGSRPGRASGDWFGCRTGRGCSSASGLPSPSGGERDRTGPRRGVRRDRPGKLAPALLVKTPTREFRGRDSRFGVRATATEASLLVAAGEVSVDGVEKPVRAGQRLDPKAVQPAAAQGVAHQIAWTRDLRNAAPLVPPSDSAGGTLVVRAPDGQERQLELREYRIDVHVEDGFARTTIDQTFFNSSEQRLEGTFRFPLPADASLSRLAMYVDGKLMEGGMAERDHARAAYERIVYERRDPALLEWVDGTTFKMRVFPLEGRQEKRLLLSYTQRLPVLHGGVDYRFPAGHSLGKVRRWSFQARIKNGAALAWRCETHQLTAAKDGADLVLGATKRDAALDRDVALNLQEPAAKEASFAAATHDGAKYLMVRYRPDLPGEGAAEPRHWVVLVETSGDRDPLLMRTQIELARSLLASAGRDDTFAVLGGATRTAGTRPARNDAAAIDEAMAGLERAHLVGAFDLGAALSAAGPLLGAGKNAHLLHLGSGIAAMGDADVGRLVSRLPKGAKYVGVGVGRRWNRSFMQAAAEATGGYFTQVNPDEPVAWRGVEIAAALGAPRLLDVTISDPAGRARFLPFSRLACQGEEVAAIARADELPARVRVTGKLDGKELSREFEVADVREGADYLPRSWAKLEIDRLLAEDAAKHKNEIVALSKAMYVMTPFTSLLVLENEDMYTQFKVDRGRKDHWAMYPAPAKIRVVYEPLDGGAGQGRPTARQVADTVITRLAYRRATNKDGRARDFDGKDGFHFGDGLLSRLSLGTEGLGEAAPQAREESRRRLGEMQRERITLLAAAPAEVAAVVGRLSGERISDNTVLESLSNASAGSLMFGLGISSDAPREAEHVARPALNLPAPTAGFGSRFRRDALGRAGAMRGGDAQEFNFFMEWSRGEGEGRGKGKMQGQGYVDGELLYRRPGPSGDAAPFTDLLRYAPGFHTSDADLLAVLEAEARPDPSLRPGLVADGARRLFEAARRSGWRSHAVAARHTSPAFTILHDRAARWAWRRTLASGLKEQVICDGKTLWHLYPELGLAAKRDVSRFHRLELAAFVPAALPAPEDLARGADLVLLDERTAALIPHPEKEEKGKVRPHVQVRFSFGEDGRLAERSWVEMPANKVVRREKCEPGESAAPELKAATDKLVVVPMPFRSVGHLHTVFKMKDRAVNDLTFAQATQLLASHVAAGDADGARRVFQQALHPREQRQLGYYALLAAAGVPLDGDAFDVMEVHPGEPLANYLAVHTSPVLRKHASRWAAASNAWGDGFLRRLGVGHALLQRWSARNLGTPAQRAAERAKALAYVKQYAGDGLAWGVLGLVQDREAEEKDGAWLDLARHYELFADAPGLGDLARYEAARCLWRAGRKDEARGRFLALQAEAEKDGALLRFDADFRAALLGAERDGWGELMRRTAGRLVERKDRAGALLLARQCWQLGDQATSQALFRLATAGLDARGKEGLALHLAGLSFLMQTGQQAACEPLLTALLGDAEHAKLPGLWRLAARVASEREQHARRLECLERALALEYAQPPEVINLDEVRRDYGGLLDEYERLARSLATLKLPAPAGFRDRVVRAADRWRGLDRDQEGAARKCAAVLRELGERELAWDYLTTPVALRPGESDVWTGLAEALKKQGERGLADLAYRSAFERESTNAQVLWDRADNLRQAGRTEEARKLFRRLAEGDWQPRFASLKEQARWVAGAE
ncbi:MAG: VIT and VWA domain-containing protein [Gemmataceae bacterium]